MNAPFSRRHFKNLNSRYNRLRRAGVASLAVMLVLSCVVLASAVSAGYLATIHNPKNSAPPPTSAKPSSHTFKTRFLPPIFNDDQNTTATVTTEKSDYQPGEYVTVTGTGWLPGEIVNLLFHQRLDEPTREDTTLMTVADGEGKIFNNEYFLEETDRGVSYVVKATGTQSGYHAQVYFTDAASATLDQCANGSLTSPDLTPCQGGDPGGEGWVNGNLGASKSHYAEGDSISYRLMMSGLSVGTHVVTIEWDTTKAGKHAIDYLTTYNRTVNSNPCEGVAGCNQGIFNAFNIPADPQVTGAGVTPVAGEFRLFGGTITNVSAYSYPDGTGFAGDKSAQITLTINATVANPVLAWGGHIGTRLDWSATNSAVSISGSPYHTRLIDLDGSGGNQDRSLSAEAVIFPASVTIIKNTVPDGPRDFNFLATGGLTPSSFTLDDDSDAPLSNTQSYFNILVTATNGNNYSVTETPVFGWDLSFNNPVCTVTSPNGGSQSATTNGVNINLREGEDVTCTFINTEDTTKTRGNIRIVKQTLPDGSSQSFTFNANYDLDGFTLTDGASNTSDQLIPSAEGGGPYSVSENAVAGWTSDGGICDNGTPNNITVVAAQTTTCTFTNTQTPKLTVIKHVINDNGGSAVAGDFTMNVTATNPSSASFPGAEAPGTTITLDAGAYSVGETGPSGYAASPSADCSGTIAPGEHKTCTITNNDQAAHLTLVKVVVNDNGGAAIATDFTLSANGPTPISGPGGVESDVNAGSYALSETNVAGYTASAWSCTGGDQNGANITLDLGESATCTITNDDQTAHLKLVKVVTNDNGGAAVATDFTLSANGPSPISGAGGAEDDVDAGSYALSETNVPGYTASAWSCVGGTQNGANVSLALGQSATCTITNDDQTAHLKLVKVVTNDNGGAAVATDFTLSANGPTPISGAGGAEEDVDAGSYALSETNVPGYTASAWSCVGGTQVGANVTLALGQSATCTITNDDQTAHLTLVKVVVNDNGGGASATDFTLSANGPTPISGAGGAEGDVNAGSYTLSETNAPGYTASAWSCVGGTQNGANVSLALGQSATCTITNDDQTAHLKLVKVVTNDNGGAAVATDFTLSATGPTPISGAGGAESNVNAGSYALSETNVPGYTASAWSCVGGTQDGANVTLALGQSATCTITNDDQTAHLKLVKVVTNDNGGTAQATDFTLSANGPTSISGAGGAEDDVDAGSYALSETNVPGYTASSWSCVGGTQNGANITLELGQSATCTITNNDQTAHLKLVKTVTNNNGGTAVPANWTLSANGPTPISGAGGAESNVNAGKYTLSESAGPGGYTAGTFSCTNGVTVYAGQITLALNQSTVCTINNDDIAPILHLRKVVINDNGGTATAADFTLTANGYGTNDLSGTSPVDSGPGLKADTWALSETTVFGYTASAWVCVGGTQNGSNITLTVGGEATCTITNNDQPGTIIIEKLIKPANSQTSFSFVTTGTGYNNFSLSGGTTNTQQLNAGSYTAKELVPLGWVLTGIGGSTDPNTPFACIVTGSGGSTGVGDLNTQTVSINLKVGDTVKCVFENTGQGVTRTQGFWATHPQLAQIAWFGGTAFGHTFPGVAGVGSLANKTLCAPVTKDIDTLGKLMGGFWSDVSRTSTGGKRSATDQARMQLLQQLLAAELNASAFGSVPSSGTFAQWEAAYCSGNANQIKTAQQQAASFNSAGDSGQFTPGTSADSKNARAIANTAFWNVLP